ncbi:MAG: hypothetical protein ACYSW4_01290 [Planctomycetota bacterium]|jgi:preprotein translocase subunit SecG
MLSFMREQEFEDSSSQKPLGAAGTTPTGGAEEPQEQEYLTVAARSRNVRKTTWLLAVLFAIGLLCLLFMIKKSTPQTATAGSGTAETQLEMAIARLTGIKSEMFNRMDEIVNKFYEFSDVQQVKVNELVKNPFERDAFWGNFRKIADTEKQNSDTAADLIRQQADQLRLLCIMQSAQGNCCMIGTLTLQKDGRKGSLDDKILHEGDSIRGFKVRQIGDSFVRLESEHGVGEPGHEIILRLSE